MTAEEDDRTPNCKAHKSTVRSREREQLGQHYSKDAPYKDFPAGGPESPGKSSDCV